jgi:sugar (pentulose or hexulose) kinase
MQKTILAIDCGTQSLKAILFSLEGEVLDMERITFEPYISPKPGWAEQDPEIYWNSLCKACQVLKSRSSNQFSAIAGVGITALRASMVNVDKNGNPLRNVIVWLDQRKAEVFYHPRFPLSFILKMIGMTETLQIAQREGKSNWIRQNEPEIWEKTYKYLQISGFLNFRLTGEFSDSVASQIGHIPFDYKRKRWGNPSDPMVFSTKLYPVEKEKLPELVEPSAILGTITGIASGLTGIPEGTQVVSCGSDKGCETLGMGVLDQKAVSLSFGTTATVQTTTTTYFEPIQFMPAYPAVIPGCFNPEVEVFRGFWMITWFKNEFAHKEILEAEKLGIPAEVILNDLLMLSPPGSMGLVLQPFWSPGLADPNAKGAMIGFGDVHKKPHIYRAVIEGLAFAMKEGLIKIEKAGKTGIDRLMVSGGASQSPAICQIVADVFDRSLLRGKTHETSGLGAAILTATGVGLYNSVKEAVHGMVNYREPVDPEPENTRIYKQLFEKVYSKMYNRLEPLYKEIREITGYPEK